MPQALLPLIPDGATRINDRISVAQENHQWTYFCVFFRPQRATPFPPTPYIARSVSGQSAQIRSSEASAPGPLRRDPKSDLSDSRLLYTLHPWKMMNIDHTISDLSFLTVDERLLIVQKLFLGLNSSRD